MCPLSMVDDPGNTRTATIQDLTTKIQVWAACEVYPRPKFEFGGQEVAVPLLIGVAIIGVNN